MSEHRLRVRPWTARLTVLVVLLAGLSIPAVATADIAYAVTQSNTLIRFDPSTPGTVDTVGPITTSPTAGVQILSIDFRTADGRLFGIGSDGFVYEINTVTATAKLPLPPGQTPQAPNPIGGTVGADFDPVTGLLRVVSDTDVNLRMTVEGGRLVDTTLSPASDISAIAFSRNVAGTNRDTLFGIDHGSNSLVRIGDADATDDVSQSQGAVHVIGPLGVDPAEDIGFDITVNPETAYAAMGAAGDPQSTLYRIDLQTGAATARGVIAAGDRVRALAIFSRPATIYLVTANREIVTIRSTAPSTPIHVARLSGDKQIRGIDVFPGTSSILGLTTDNLLVTIDPQSGFVRPYRTIKAVLPGTGAEVDFRPSVNGTDDFQVLTDTGQRFSVSPSFGTASAQPLTGAAGVTSIAFTNNRFHTTTSTMLGVDTTADRFGRIDNLTTTGTFVPIGPLGIDAVAGGQLDVSGTDNTIFATLRTSTSGPTTLYVIDPGTGAATSLGALPAGMTILGMSVAGSGWIDFAVAGNELKVSEASSSQMAVVAIERFGGLTEPVSATIDVVGGGTATEGADYSAALFFPITVHFASGERIKTVEIPIISDTVEETDETIKVRLSAAEGGATIFADFRERTVTIVDDDHPLPAGITPTIRISDPTEQPTYAAVTPFITLSGVIEDGDGFLSLHPIQSVTWTTGYGDTGTAHLGPQDEPSGGNARITFLAKDVPIQPGDNIIEVKVTDVQGHTSLDTLVVTLHELKYVLAEGAIGTFFDTDLLLANPNVGEAQAQVEYLVPGGGKVTKYEVLGDRARKTIAVDDLPELAGVGEVSMVVTADAFQPLAVERTMRWGTGRYGAHTDKATDGPRLNWYFAEGSQGFFSTYVLLANPNPFPIKAQVLFLQEGMTFPMPPAMPPTFDHELPAFSRLTVDAGSVPQLANTSFGIRVVFDGPGVAERAMYFGTNPLWVGGHESAGVTSPAHEWFLAEGATGSFFSTFILLANPSTNAKVDMTFFPADGPPVQKPQFTLGAGQRLTLNVAEQDPSLANAAVATRVVSDQPIVVERAQYWPNPPQNWYEAHNAFGVTSLGKGWALAEGRVGGPEAYQTYILLANPGSTDARVGITFLRENGATFMRLFTVPAGRRFNVQIDGAPGGIDLHDENFGALISSDVPIVVERAMYGNATGQVWQMGTNAVATRLW